MKLEVAVKSVQTMAVDAGLPESLIDRHIDALCKMAIRVKSQERKNCKNQLRKWMHETPLTRDPLLSILDE
jgi:hypothetical protein